MRHQIVDTKLNALLLSLIFFFSFQLYVTTRICSLFLRLLDLKEVNLYFKMNGIVYQN